MSSSLKKADQLFAEKKRELTRQLNRPLAKVVIASSSGLPVQRLS